MTSDTTFLFSNFHPPGATFFQGYCFIGGDYIFGSDGALAYMDSSGSNVGGDNDGCYVTATRAGSSIIFQNDYSGYKKLFYYHDGENWAVGNSIVQVSRHLADHGVLLKPNYAPLAAIKRAGPAFSQLFTFETPIRGVKLAPLRADLVITPERALTLPTRQSQEKPAYNEALREHLTTWIQRLRTLLLEPRINLTFDVTGGADSRANLAMLLVAMQGLGLDESSVPRLRCGSSEKNTRDLEVATELCRHYELPLNDERRFPRTAIGGIESFEAWRDLCLGSYHPIYLPASLPSGHNVSFGGGGAGIHRPFYENHIGSDDPDRFVSAQVRKIDPEFLQPEFRSDAELTMRVLSKFAPRELLLIEHYRQFRARLHAGRSPQYGVTFTPFSSAILDKAHAAAGSERLKLGQLNFDIMNSLEPALLDFPFDDARKAPSERSRELLSQVGPLSDVVPGKAWSGFDSPRLLDSGDSTVWKHLISAFEEAADDAFVTSFWGRDKIEDVHEMLLNASSLGRFSHAVAGTPVSAVLMAHEVSRTALGSRRIRTAVGQCGDDCDSPVFEVEG